MKNSIIKSDNIQNAQSGQYDKAILQTTKGVTWNNRRRYSFLTQYKFI